MHYLDDAGLVLRAPPRGLVKWIRHELCPAHFRGITERELKDKLSRAVERSPTCVVLTDLHGTIQYVNHRFWTLTGYTPDEAQGQNPHMLKSGEMAPEHYRQLWKTIHSGREWHGAFHNRKKSGDLYWELSSIFPIKDEDGRTSHFVAVNEDITESVSEKARIVGELQASKAKPTALRHSLFLCAWCKRTRDQEGNWSRVDTGSPAGLSERLSHGICPECRTMHFQGILDSRTLHLQSGGTNVRTRPFPERYPRIKE